MELLFVYTARVVPNQLRGGARGSWLSAVALLCSVGWAKALLLGLVLLLCLLQCEQLQVSSCKAQCEVLPAG